MPMFRRSHSALLFSIVCLPRARPGQAVASNAHVPDHQLNFLPNKTGQRLRCMVLAGRKCVDLCIRRDLHWALTGSCIDT